MPSTFGVYPLFVILGCMQRSWLVWKRAHKQGRFWLLLIAAGSVLVWLCGFFMAMRHGPAWTGAVRHPGRRYTQLRVDSVVLVGRGRQSSCLYLATLQVFA